MTRLYFENSSQTPPNHQNTSCIVLVHLGFSEQDIRVQLDEPSGKLYIGPLNLQASIHTIADDKPGRYTHQIPGYDFALSRAQKLVAIMVNKRASKSGAAIDNVDQQG